MNAAKRSAVSAYSSALPTTAQTATQNVRAQNTPVAVRNQPQGDASNSTKRHYRPKREPYAGARQTLAFESAVKLTVNLLLATVATTTLAKLLPYYQSEQQRLTTLQTSVAVAERKNADLRSQFEHNFDPAQGARIMQEQSGMGYPNQKKVIWNTPQKNEPQKND